ncbi:MAG: hypothetical protein ACRDP3_14590, partial [Streptomyces sp.]|uniref:hypothetical protein n=1 Tax=Streptomyces sp. TaxID=1931 RepID=UPI003D6B9CBA
MPKAAQGAAKSRTARTTRPARGSDAATTSTPRTNVTGTFAGTGSRTGSAAGTKPPATKPPSPTPPSTGSAGSTGTAAKTADTDDKAPSTTARTTRTPAPSAFRRPAEWLRRAPGWWPVPLCLVLGSVGGAVYAAVAAPQYVATSYVIVSPRGQADTGSALGYAQAYGRIATDPMILADAESEARLKRGTLKSAIQASTSPDAPLVQITGTSERPGQAAEYADAVARALSHTAKDSVKRTGAGLSVLADSAAPADPVTPSFPVAVAVGGCAGGLLGGLVLLARPRRRRPGT